MIDTHIVKTLGLHVKPNAISPLTLDQFYRVNIDIIDKMDIIDKIIKPFDSTIFYITKEGRILYPDWIFLIFLMKSLDIAKIVQHLQPHIIQGPEPVDTYEFHYKQH